MDVRIMIVWETKRKMDKSKLSLLVIIQRDQLINGTHSKRSFLTTMLNNNEHLLNLFFA
jgi:hypothetical protein